MLQRFLFITLTLCSLTASAQWQQTGAKVRYVNGLGIPTKDTAAGVSADSSQIVIRPQDSALYIKYKRTWVKVGGGSVSGTTNYVAKFTSATALGNSQIFDNGTSVGIGTVSPAVKLQSNISTSGLPATSGTTQTNGALRLSATGITAGILDFGINGSNNWIQSTDFTNLSLTYNLLLNPNGGNVGIGTASPAAKLSVQGTTLINTNVDNGVDKLQVSGSAISTRYKVNTSGQTTEISNYYNGGIGKNLWIGGGGASSTSASERNVSIGVDAMLNNTSGYFNVALGSESSRNITSGFRNMAIGFQALYSITTGSRNTAIGNEALGSTTAGTNNIAIGTSALVRQTGGSSNIVLGDAAGMLISGGGDLTSCDQSILIGQDTRPSANGNTNEIVIGHNAIGQGSNSVTLGNSSITKTFLRGSVMVNTTTDNGVDKLQVNGSISGTGMKQNYVAKTGAYTATDADYVIDCTANTFTVTLPASSGRTGRILIIKNSGAGTITVDGNGAETIDGAATYSLSVQYETIQIMSDGTNWKIIAKF